MSVLLRMLLIIGAVSMMVFMLNKIRQARMKIEFTVFWIGFASVLIIMGVFPQIFYWISDFIGFQAPISMVYLVVIFVLIIKSFFMTIHISQLENKIDNLVQQVAIEKKMKETLKDEDSELDK